jgi:hypothetical protein
MDETKGLLGRPEVITCGRHTIKITPPNLEWWLEAIVSLRSIQVRAETLQKSGDYGVSTLLNAFERPSLAILDLLARTTDKRPVPAYRIVRAEKFPRYRLQRVPAGEWIKQNMTPLEFGIFIKEWLRVIDIKGIKDVFLAAGEEAGLKAKPIAVPSAASPAASSGSPTPPAGN